jgi:hypothetical protein
MNIKNITFKKAFDIIQHPFMIKTVMKLGIEGMYLNTMKVIYDKPIVNIIPNGEKNETIFSKVRNKTRVFTLSTLIQHNLAISRQSNKTGRRKKGIQI